MVSVSMVVQGPPPAGRRWNSAVATPEPASAESEETATAAPVTKAASAGAVSEPVGLVRSTVTLTTSAPVLPAPSVATARRARLPSGSIAQEAEYGAVVSTPSEIQEPDEQPALAFEQRKSSTSSTSPSGVEAVTVNGIGSRGVDEAGGRGDRDARGVVVDGDGAGGGGEGVAGLVGGEDAEVEVAVGE